MRSFFTEYNSSKELEKMKSDEMLRYEEKKAELEDEISQLKIQRLLTTELRQPVLTMGLNPFLPYNNYQNQVNSDITKNKHDRICNQLAQRKMELERLEANKPEDIHFQFQLKK